MFNNRFDVKSLMAKAIKEYESDIFSADYAKITEQEANKIARFFIRRFLGGGSIRNKATGENALDAMSVDGSQIQEVLDWIREGELKGLDY